jgi:hypothetical protein
MPAGSGSFLQTKKWEIDWGRSDPVHDTHVVKLHASLAGAIKTLLLSKAPYGTAPDGSPYLVYPQEDNGLGLSLNVRETLDDVAALFGCLQRFQNVDSSKKPSSQTPRWPPSQPSIQNPDKSAFVFMFLDLKHIVEYCSLVVWELQNKPNDKGVTQSKHFADVPSWWKPGFPFQDNAGNPQSLPDLPVSYNNSVSNFPPASEQGCYLACVGYLYFFCGEMLNKQWNGSKPTLPDVSKAPDSIDGCMDLMKTMADWIATGISQLTWQIPI